MLLKNSVNNIDFVNPISIPNWNDLILRHEKYSIFHSKEWCHLLNKTYGYEPYYLHLPSQNSSDFLIPFMEVKSLVTGKRIVSLPFSDYCEPLIQSDLLPEILICLKKLNNLKDYKYLEFRGGENLFTDEPVNSAGYKHKLDLNINEKTLFANLRSSNKRNIKKAIREGVEVKISRDFKSMIDFYNLNIITRKRHGLPPQPFVFFKNIGELLMPGGFCEIAESVYKGKVIASCVFLIFGKKILYKFGASDYNFQNLRANDLLFWEAIKHYSQLNYEEFCFGRTEAQNESLRHFKLGWGTSESLSPYYRYNFKNMKFESRNKFTLDSPGETGYHNYIFKHAPKPFLKLIGNITYRHIG